MLHYKPKLCAILRPKLASFTTSVSNEIQCNKVSQDLAVPRTLPLRNFPPSTTYQKSPASVRHHRQGCVVCTQTRVRWKRGQEGERAD